MGKAGVEYRPSDDETCFCQRRSPRLYSVPPIVRLIVNHQGASHHSESGMAVLGNSFRTVYEKLIGSVPFSRFPCLSSGCAGQDNKEKYHNSSLSN